MNNRLVSTSGDEGLSLTAKAQAWDLSLNELTPAQMSYMSKAQQLSLWKLAAPSQAKCLWLDDTRKPPKDGRKWDWARNVHEAIYKLQHENQHYDHMSLDHDLGMVYHEGKVVVNPDALSGGDFVAWLHEHGDKKHMPETCELHTHNHTSVEIMKRLLENHCEVTVKRADPSLEESWAKEFKVHFPSEIKKEVVHLPEEIPTAPEKNPKLVRTAHLFGWTPGQEGKGIVAPEGNIYTWITDKDGHPHHAEWLDREQPYQLHEGTGHFFKINPDGTLDAESYSIPPEILEYVMQNDPRLIAGKETKSRTAAVRDELHIGLDVPQQAAIEINQWVYSIEWPDGTEFLEPDEYHITLLFCQGSDAGDHREDDWPHKRHAISVTAIREFPASEENDGLHPIVLLVKGDSLREHHDQLVDAADEKGLDSGDYVRAKYKPHIIIAYGPGLPDGLKAPSITFETDVSSVSAPREASVELDNGAIMSAWQPISNITTRLGPNTITGRIESSFATIGRRSMPRSRSSWTDMRQSMAADPRWINSFFQKATDPYLYHISRAQYLPSIREKGLLPGNQVGHTGILWDSTTIPRPNHVYLGIGRGWFPSYKDPANLRVHYQNLDPQLMNPDEDYMAERIGELGVPDYGPTIDRGGSYGDWAQENDFVHPDLTHGSLEKHHRIAYNGSIAPQYLEIQKGGFWYPLLQEQLFSKRVKHKTSYWSFACPNCGYNSEAQDECACKRCGWNMHSEKIEKQAAAKERPPNLKEAKGHKSCQTCWAFNKGKCEMFGGYEVDADDVCDDWEEHKISMWKLAFDWEWEKPEAYYHSAPTEDRARIWQHGLQPSLPKRNPRWDDVGFSFEDEPEGVYMAYEPHHTLADEEDWEGNPSKMDIWKIDPAQVYDEEADPHAESVWAVTPHAVPPDALTLHTPYEQTIAWPKQESSKTSSRELVCPWCNHTEYDPEASGDQIDLTCPRCNNRMNPTWLNDMFNPSYLSDDGLWRVTRWQFKGAVGDGDGYVQCEQGHTHWGKNGAAGLMLQHTDPEGVTRYLLQHRSPNVMHGDTWSIPGGAIDSHETPEEGALREVQEEFGHEIPQVQFTHKNTVDHGGWAYHTIHGAVPEMFNPTVQGWETSNYGWFTPQEIDQLPLHPGFRSYWNGMRESSVPMNELRRFIAADSRKTRDSGLNEKKATGDSWRPRTQWPNPESDLGTLDAMEERRTDENECTCGTGWQCRLHDPRHGDDEGSRTWRQSADEFQNSDSRQYPDARMLAPNLPPEKSQAWDAPQGTYEGCTCGEDSYSKEHCPIHGLDPQVADPGLEWSIPEGSPTGWHQLDYTKRNDT